MGKKILLIQPHSDDILFSASHYLFNSKPEDDVVVLTVEYNKKRLAEDEEVCQHFGAKLMTLEVKADSTNFHKEYYSLHTQMDDESALDFCVSKMGTETFLKLEKELRKTLKKFKKDGYTIVTCLGVGHPFHWLTRILTQDKADLFYRDFPHSYKRRNQAYLNGIVNSEFELSFTSNPDKEHAIKIDLVKSYYKTQSSLLFFEKRYIEKCLPEEFYEKIKN
jgi:hypothetical protein